VVRHFLNTVIGHIGYTDAVLSRCCYVNTVVAYTGNGNETAFSQTFDYPGAKDIAGSHLYPQRYNGISLGTGRDKFILSRTERFSYLCPQTGQQFIVDWDESRDIEGVNYFEDQSSTSPVVLLGQQLPEIVSVIIPPRAVTFTSHAEISPRMTRKAHPERLTVLGDRIGGPYIPRYTTDRL